MDSMPFLVLYYTVISLFVYKLFARLILETKRMAPP